MSLDSSQKILSACLKWLTPIARVLLANGIGYREFDDVVRRAFVASAIREFGVRGRQTNTSRVSAMTGLPRKEVKRLRRLPAVLDDESTRLLSPLGDLLFVWATDDEYRDEAGNPLPLNLAGNSQPSFELLVRRCVGDVPPGAVKAELMRLGAVGFTDENKLKLLRRTLIPPESDRRLESAILYSLRGLAASVAHNNDPETPPQQRFFERYVESRPMFEDEIDEMRLAIREKLTEISEEFDSFVNAPPSREPGNFGRRIGVGLYYTEVADED